MLEKGEAFTCRSHRGDQNRKEWEEEKNVTESPSSSTKQVKLSRRGSKFFEEKKQK